MIVHVIEGSIEVPFHFFKSSVFVQKESYKFLELHCCHMVLLWAPQFLLDLARKPLLETDVSLILSSKTSIDEIVDSLCHLLVGNQCLGQTLAQHTCMSKPTCQWNGFQKVTATFHPFLFTNTKQGILLRFKRVSYLDSLIQLNWKYPTTTKCLVSRWAVKIRRLLWDPS